MFHDLITRARRVRRGETNNALGCAAESYRNGADSASNGPLKVTGSAKQAHSLVHLALILAGELVTDAVSVLRLGPRNQSVSGNLEIARRLGHGANASITVRLLGVVGIDDADVYILLQRLKRSVWHGIARKHAERSLHGKTRCAGGRNDP